MVFRKRDLDVVGKKDTELWPPDVAERLMQTDALVFRDRKAIEEGGGEGTHERAQPTPPTT